MSESLAQRLAALCWLPNTPPLTACGRMGSEQIERANERIWKSEMPPWTLVPSVCLLHPPHPHLAKQGKGMVFGDQRIAALVSVLQTTIIIRIRQKIAVYW